MKAAKFCCVHCRRRKPATKVGQRYCGRKECQAARKRKWRCEKYAEDSDYRLTQQESTATWLESQGGAAKYHRDYRRRKREQQFALQKVVVQPFIETPSDTVLIADPKAMVADQKTEVPSTVASRPFCASVFAWDERSCCVPANSDAMVRNNTIETGIYRMFAVGANNDAMLVKIQMISYG